MDKTSKQLSLYCSQCQKPPDQNMIVCSICEKNYHISCTNATADQISTLTYKCQICNMQPSDSIRSTSSRSSKTYEDRRVQLKLQQLEEERSVSMAFISKKYKIINQHESDRQSVTSSQMSQSVVNWLEDIPVPTVDQTQCDPRSATENENAVIEQSAQLPVENVNYLHAPLHNVNKNLKNVSTISNIPAHYNRSFVPPISTSSATMTFSAPGVSTHISNFPNTIGPQQRQQPYQQSAAFEPTILINTLPSSTNPPLASTINFTHPQQNIPIYSTQDNFNQPSNTNNPNNLHSFVTDFNHTNPRLNQSQLQARHSLPKELSTFFRPTRRMAFIFFYFRMVNQNMWIHGCREPHQVTKMSTYRCPKKSSTYVSTSVKC